MSAAGRFATDPATVAIRLTASAFLSEAYVATDPNFDGRVTVPVLWDKETRRIVNNSEDDICRMFNDPFREFGNRTVDLFPQELEADQAKLSVFVYELREQSGV